MLWPFHSFSVLVSTICTKRFPCPDSSSIPTHLLSQSICPAEKIGAIPHNCLNLRASESESKSKLCGYLYSILYFSTISSRLTITNLLLRSPFSSFNLENQTGEFTIQFSHEFSTSLCWPQIIFMLRTFHFLSLPSKNFHINLKDFDSLLYIQLKFGGTKLY